MLQVLLLAVYAVDTVQIVSQQVLWHDGNVTDGVCAGEQCTGTKEYCSCGYDM